MVTGTSDYKRMAKVIYYLNVHYTEQPTLDSLADVAGLSPFHFQRKFTEWVGVSPKSFLQYLTLNDARRRLRSGDSVDHAAWGTGLSGPSRLYDLCVKLDAATPGEIRRAGEGLEVKYGFGYSPFGRCLAGISERGIVHLGFVDEDGQDAVDVLQALWPRARMIRDDHQIRNFIRSVFNNEKKQRKPVRAYVNGTRFQLRVWRALLDVPPGMLLSYAELAKKIGRPSAARAVGSAVGSNPLAYLIPCHRVIRSTGVSGDYRWGKGRKKVMIARELAMQV